MPALLTSTSSWSGSLGQPPGGLRDAGVVGHVERQGVSPEALGAQQGGRFLAACEIAAAEPYLVARLGELAGDFPADAPVGAGDECCFDG
ncbi:MAG: hypothetical protein QM713_00015 [Arachnia sp.]